MSVMIHDKYTVAPRRISKQSSEPEIFLNAEGRDIAPGWSGTKICGVGAARNMVIWSCDVVLSMSNQSRTQITDQGGSRLLVLSTPRHHRAVSLTLSNNTGLKLVGSLYLTEIKQVHSEDDKIIIIDTFEGCQVLLEHH